MAKLDGVFDATTVPERNDFSPIPPGSYTAMITHSELKDTSTGGQMIVLELDIQEGEFTGRKLFERLNIKNDNPKAVDIAFRTLGEIVKAVGKTTIKDTEELHNKRLYVEVRIEPAQPYKDKKTGEQKEGSPQNSIKKFLPVSGGATKSSTPVGATESTSKAVEAKSEPAAGGSVPPWRQKKA
jgi:hypothetical protein